jgi:hypothetical protein
MTVSPMLLNSQTSPSIVVSSNLNKKAKSLSKSHSSLSLNLNLADINTQNIDAIKIR